MTTNDSPTEIAIAFVGCLVPDESGSRNAAFSQAGQMYQSELLLGLRSAGLLPSIILSIIPIPAYPKSPRIWITSDKSRLVGGVRVRFLPFLNITPLKQVTIGLSTVWELLKWGWRSRHASFRAVYSYNLSVPPGLFTLIGARCIGARALVSLCDINVPGETVPAGLAWRLDYWLHRKLIPRFDGHVVASEATASDFLPGRPYVLLEGGIGNELLDRTGDANRRCDTSSECFVVSTAGRLDESNGILTVLRAFAQLEGGQYRLRIAGTGPFEALVREAALADPRIEYLGLISFDDVLKLYSSSHVLVNMRMTKTLNTRYFFPSKMMEYLASGTPVITTSAGHIEKEFGSFVYLLESETSEALANTIRLVASQDAQHRQEMGQKARTYMRTHKMWQMQTQRVAQYIRQTVLGIESASAEGQTLPQRVQIAKGSAAELKTPG